MLMSRPVVPVGYVIDEVFLAHRSPPGHPERPERLAAVLDGLRRSGLATLGQQLATRRAEDHEVGLVHTAGYWDDVRKAVPGHAGYLDEDTFFSPGSWDAALSAVAAAVDLTRATLSGQFQRSFAVVRPPGHHAEPDRAMGFCLFNNVAIAAAAARAAGAARVAIVDWDVHHGNGTQNAFYRDPHVLYISTHQWPLYPGTGAADEIGAGEGVGANINLPLPPEAGDAEYAAAFDEIVVPALRAFKPDLLFVSAGFDAFVADPLAQMKVSAAGYRRMAACLRGVADEVCGGRLVAVLEGGYDLGGLDACAGELFTELAGERTSMPTPSATAIDATARQRLTQVKRALGGRWGIPCP
jgi:acetoin utilization deacetylase AcuC-like enzyme